MIDDNNLVKTLKKNGVAPFVILSHYRDLFGPMDTGTFYRKINGKRGMTSLEKERVLQCIKKAGAAKGDNFELFFTPTHFLTH